MPLHLIADFGPNDLAFAEVAQRLMLVLPEAELVLTAVPPFATLAAGFCAAQLGLNDAPSVRRVVFRYRRVTWRFQRAAAAGRLSRARCAIERCAIELFLRGGSAWEAFGRPEVGDEVQFVVDGTPA